MVIFPVFFYRSDKSIHKRNDLLPHVIIHQRIIIIDGIAALHIHEGDVRDGVLPLRGRFIADIDHLISLGAPAAAGITVKVNFIAKIIGNDGIAFQRACRFGGTFSHADSDLA